MGLIDNAIDAFRFKDTIFYKEDSDLQDKYDALFRLNKEFPNNDDLLFELFIVKKGLEGENEIAYQLKKSNIGMYVLRDIKVKYEELSAQIDYVVLTPLCTYFIECKNLVGNIVVNEKGDFIRELYINGKTIKKGMYSPLRQVEAQREVIRKIWESRASTLNKIFNSKDFNKYRKVLVVASNKETILDTTNAPSDMKYKILRADSLIRQIEYDFSHRDKDEALMSKKTLEDAAKSYIEVSYKEKIDYYDFYKRKYCNTIKIVNDNLKERLIEFRKNRAKEMNIPAYYVFTNDELDKLVELKPKTSDKLKNLIILTPVKIKTHGEKIIEIIIKN